jgi:ribosomal protein L37AE/L43A
MCPNCGSELQVARKSYSALGIYLLWWCLSCRWNAAERET